MSIHATSHSAPFARRSTLVLAISLGLVLALTALVTYLNPVPPAASDPLQRDDKMAASDAARNAMIADDLYRRGIRIRDNGDLRAAKATFKHVLEIQPNNMDAIQALGEVFYVEQNYEHARTLFEQCLAERPERMDSYANLAIVHLSVADFAKADAVATQGLAALPEDARGHLYLILACAREGQDKHDEEVQYLALARQSLGEDFGALMQSRWAEPLLAAAERDAIADDPTSN